MEGRKYEDLLANSSWLKQIDELSRKRNDIRKQYWDVENQLILLESQILQLENTHQLSYSKQDLEKIYPSSHKINNVRMSDYKLVKFPELKDRLNKLANKKVDVKSLQSQLNQHEKNYTTYTEKFKESDQALSTYCKKESLERKFRDNVRNDINNLVMADRIKTVSSIPGALSLSVLMDIFAQLKLIYEKSLRELLTEITGNNKKFENFEDLFRQTFRNDEAKDRYKKFANNPVSGMSKVSEEFSKINQAFWLVINPGNKKQYDQDKVKQFNECFFTTLYLSSTHETFSFTDRVQRITDAFFPDASTAYEFTQKLSVTQIQNSFAVMPFSSSMVKPISDTDELWREALIWIYGFHQKSLSELSPQFKEGDKALESALTHVGDYEDSDLFNHRSPLVKWVLAQYHEPHFRSLLKSLPENLVQEVMRYIPKPVSNNPFDQGNVSNSYNPFAEGSVISQKAYKANAMFQPDQSVIQEAKKIPFSQLAHELKEVEDKTELTKFAKLNSLLTDCDLNERQKTDLLSIKERIKAVYQLYVGAWFSSKWYVPTIVVSRPHYDDVKAALEFLEQATPNEYICQLYTIWSKTSKESKEIRPKAQEILTAAYEILVSPVELKNEKQKIM